MSTVPPPPPGPPPPPPPAVLPTMAKDRGALLKQIEKGSKLKKAMTNDRSGPILDSNKQSDPSAPKTTINKPQNNAPQGLGGLFAQGMPKLKPSGSRGEKMNELSEPTRNSTTTKPAFALPVRPPVPTLPRKISAGESSRPNIPPPPLNRPPNNIPVSIPPRQPTNAPPAPPPRRLSAGELPKPIPAPRTMPSTPPVATKAPPPPPPRSNPPPISPRSSVSTPKYETEGGFQFKLDFPPPREFVPESVQNPPRIASRTASGTPKSRPPPPPPPSRRTASGPPSTGFRQEAETFIQTSSVKLEQELQKSIQTQDFMKCAKIKQILDDLNELKGTLASGNEPLAQSRYKSMKQTVNSL